MRIRVAAAGDIHTSEEERARLEAAFVEAEQQADLILLAGDLTTYGEPEQAAVLADITNGIGIPVFAVLGNHDWHADRRDEIVAILRGGGVRLLERDSESVEVGGAGVGIVGTKGFIGGFPDAQLPDFGEPLLRRVYAEGMEEVAALDEGLRAVAMCPFRIVLLHYAPTTQTLEGERREIWSFLGTDRLAAPILEHGPDMVLHGHAHAGTFEGSLGGVPVYNVSVPVLGEDFWVFELAGVKRTPSEVH
jgi:uncharacterized protein